MWLSDKTHADAVLLDPNDAAFADRGIIRQHQAKARGYEGRVLNIDSGTLGRHIADGAAHDRAA